MRRADGARLMARASGLSGLGGPTGLRGAGDHQPAHVGLTFWVLTTSRAAASSRDISALAFDGVLEVHAPRKGGRHVGCAAACSKSLVASSASSVLKDAPRMGANSVLFTSGRKPCCSALTGRLVKRDIVGLRLPDSSSSCAMRAGTRIASEHRFVSTHVRLGRTHL